MIIIILMAQTGDMTFGRIAGFVDSFIRNLALEVQWVYGNYFVLVHEADLFPPFFLSFFSFFWGGWVGILLSIWVNIFF